MLPMMAIDVISALSETRYQSSNRKDQIFRIWHARLAMPLDDNLSFFFRRILGEYHLSVECKRALPNILRNRTRTVTNSDTTIQ